MCDPQWNGGDCGVLALLPADPTAGYQRAGFNAWGGNPFFAQEDKKYHAFVVEMTKGCPIGNYLTNSQIIHVESTTAAGPYALAPIAGSAIGFPGLTGDEKAAYRDAAIGGPAPASAVLVAPFAHAAHTERDPASGALVVVFEGRTRVPDAQQKKCGST
jgi:hypothetical protein